MRPVRFLSACVWFRDVTSFSDAPGMVCVRAEPVSILTHQTHCFDSLLLERRPYQTHQKMTWRHEIRHMRPKNAQDQWRSQPKILGGAKMFDCRRIILFCWEKRVQRTKCLYFLKMWGDVAPLEPPWLRLRTGRMPCASNLSTTYSGRKSRFINGKSHHSNTSLKSILFGEAIRLRRLNQRNNLNIDFKKRRSTQTFLWTWQLTC